MSSKGNILLVANWDSDIGYAWWLMESFWVTIADHFRQHGMQSYLAYPSITKIPDSITTSDIQTIELDFKDHSLPALKKLHHLISKNNIQ